MVNKRILSKINPIVLSCFIFIILIYLNILSVKKGENFISPLKKHYIYSLSGEFCSNSVKWGSKYYKATLKCFECYGTNKEYANCSGYVKVLIPSSMVEAYFPGKLYSKTNDKQALICESGANAELYGRFTDDNVFIVFNAKKLPWKSDFIGILKRNRAILRMNFRRLMFAFGPAGGLILALLSGIKEYTDKDITLPFRYAGLSHVLALSGMHLTLFSHLPLIFKKTFLRLVMPLIELIMILLFVLFAGLSPSLLRALICALCSIICKSLDIDTKMLNILCFSFLIHILLRPSDVYEIGFILSYASLLGIVLLNEHFIQFFIKLIPILFCTPFCASLSALSFTGPISLKLFKAIYPVGLVSSVIISPLITMFIYISLFFIIICLIFPCFVPLAVFFTKILYTLIKSCIFFFAAFPYFSLGA